MREAIITKPFSNVQWFGEDYPDYVEDAEANTFQEGDKVSVLLEVEPNPMGRLFVVYNKRINESAVISEIFFDFVDTDTSPTQ